MQLFNNVQMIEITHFWVIFNKNNLEEIQLAKSKTFKSKNFENKLREHVIKWVGWSLIR